MVMTHPSLSPQPGLRGRVVGEVGLTLVSFTHLIFGIYECMWLRHMVDGRCATVAYYYLINYVCVRTCMYALSLLATREN